METLICHSYQSFLDFCDNDLVRGVNVHCTFPLLAGDELFLQQYLTQKGGHELSFTSFLNRELV